MAIVDLAAEVDGHGTPLVVLHGLFGSAHNWGLIARRLSDIRTIHRLDLRNHGASPWVAGMSYPEMAADVAAYLARLDGPVDLLGHSMGGKTAMRVALDHPERIRRLIVVDIAPAAYKREDYPAYIAAMRTANLSRATRRSEVEAQLAPAVPDPALRAFLVQNLLRDGDRFRWRLNLDALDAGMDDIIGWPTPSGQFDGPVTFLAGERSNYIRPRDEAIIRGLFPAARLVEIGDAGHWAHAEQPERFLALVREALG